MRKLDVLKESGLDSVLPNCCARQQVIPLMVMIG